MDENLPVPYSNLSKYEGECVKLRERPKKKHHFILKFFILFFLIFCIYSLFTYRAQIKGFFENIFNKDSTNEIPKTENSLPNQDEENNDSNKIIVNTATGGIENESDIDISQIENSFVPTDIETIYETYGESAPVVLIIHSMANESFSNGDFFNHNDAKFYSDTNNVSSLAKNIVHVLNENGINAIHIDTIFNSGTIHGSKVEYQTMLENILLEYPSISYVLDISRGVFVNDDLSISKYTTEIKGVSCANIDLILGMGDELNENKQNNFVFASALFENLEKNNFKPSLKISNFDLKQNISPHMIKVDIGSYGNSYEEAENASFAFANILVNMLKKAE